MTILQFTNNAQTTIASPISNSATSVTLAAGGGALFPTPSAGQGFYLTFSNAPTPSSYEIVFCSARSGDTLTIVRGQDGTSAAAWNTGDFAGLYATAADLNSMVQIDQLQDGKYQVAGSVAGTANAITATLPSNLTAIPNALPITFIAAAANTGATTLDLTLGVTDTTALAIVKQGDIALSGGEIPGAGYPVELVYSLTYGAWVMTNPVLPAAAIGVRGQSSGLISKVTSNTQIAISFTEAIVESSSGVYNVVKAGSFTINTANSGVNGVDTGSISANAWWYAYIIYNPTTNTINGTLSLNSTAPALPAGYTSYARASSLRTNSSSNLLATIKENGVNQYIVGGSNVANIPQMISGISGNAGTPVWTAVAWANFAPPVAWGLDLLLINTVNQAAICAPNNSYGAASSGSNPPPLVAWPATTNTAVHSLGLFVLESSNIYYASDNAGGALFCRGWRD